MKYVVALIQANKSTEAKKKQGTSIESASGNNYRQQITGKDFGGKKRLALFQLP